MKLAKIELQSNGDVWFFFANDTNDPCYSFEFDGAIERELEEIQMKIHTFNEVFKKVER